MPTHNRSKMQGLMLLEVMVGILIFSVGVLGLVGLMAKSTSSLADSKYRSDASFLASQLIGQMWGDRNHLSSYAYAGSGAPPTALASWVTEVKSMLPGVESPKVAVDTGNQVTVTISWKPRNISTPHTYTTISYING